MEGSKVNENIIDNLIILVWQYKEIGIKRII